MACPCFYPLAPAPIAIGRKAPPMPLGDAWSGVCRAVPGSEPAPAPIAVQQFCNFGYARGKCARVPEDAPDAVRFSISDDRDGVIRIHWVVEKNHLPFAHGPLHYLRARGAFTVTHPDPCIARQAEAYVAGYLRRKEEAVRP